MLLLHFIPLYAYQDMALSNKTGLFLHKEELYTVIGGARSCIVGRIGTFLDLENSPLSNTESATILLFNFKAVYLQN